MNLDPDRRAAGLAALAEAGPLGLIAHLVASGAAVSGLTLPLFLPLFAAGFTAAVLVAMSFRQSRALGPVAAGAAVVVGLIAGRGGADRLAFAVLIALLVAARILTLTLRDWRDPVATSVVAGALVLGVEAILASGAQPSWTGPLLVVIPVFFAASFASRATSVWSAGDAADLDEPTRLDWGRAAGRWTLAIAGVVAAVVLVGAQGGLLSRLGALLAPFGRAIVAVVVGTLAFLLQPVFWAVQRAHVDTTQAEQILTQLRVNADRANQEAAQQTSHGTPLGRVLTLLLLFGLAWLAVRWLRRLRPADEGAHAQVPGAGEVTATAIPEPEVDTPARPHGLRREPPADAVRRWYGESLAALARAGLPKADDRTPAEFEVQVGAADPAVSADLAALTRAYEDVRYGARTFGADDLGRLRQAHRSVLDAANRLRRAGGPSTTDGGSASNA